MPSGSLNNLLKGEYSMGTKRPMPKGGNGGTTRPTPPRPPSTPR